MIRWHQQIVQDAVTFPRHAVIRRYFCEKCRFLLLSFQKITDNFRFCWELVSFCCAKFVEKKLKLGILSPYECLNNNPIEPCSGRTSCWVGKFRILFRSCYGTTKFGVARKAQNTKWENHKKFGFCPFVWWLSGYHKKFCTGGPVSVFFLRKVFGKRKEEGIAKNLGCSMIEKLDFVERSRMTWKWWKSDNYQNVSNIRFFPAFFALPCCLLIIWEHFAETKM